MNAVKVGRLRRDRGISVARPTALGNPFEVGEPYTRAESISRYRFWFASELERGYEAARGGKPPTKVIAQLERLIAAARRSDVTLLCNCVPLPCHAEVIVEHIQRTIGQEIADSLSPGARRVFDYLVRGHSTDSIAEKLGLSHYTVANHTRASFAAFQCKQRAEIVAIFGSPPLRRVVEAQETTP